MQHSGNSSTSDHYRADAAWAYLSYLETLRDNSLGVAFEVVAFGSSVLKHRVGCKRCRQGFEVFRKDDMTVEVEPESNVCDVIMDSTPPKVQAAYYNVLCACMTLSTETRPLFVAVQSESTLVMLSRGARGRSVN